MAVLVVVVVSSVVEAVAAVASMAILMWMRSVAMGLGGKLLLSACGCGRGRPCAGHRDPCVWPAAPVLSGPVIPWPLKGAPGFWPQS